MIAAATAEALNRIAARAQDVARAYTAGGFASSNDVNTARAPEFSADALSVAAPQNAYFVTERSNGTRSFTRDGGFALEGGTLRGADGSAILGYPGGDARGTLPVPLTLPANDVALGRCTNVRVESDGMVSYTRATIDPRTTERGVERVTAGKIALARFPAGTQPVRLDERHVGAPQGIPPHLGTPADGTFAGLATYARDTGTVDVDTSLAKLSEAYRAFSALRGEQSARGNRSNRDGSAQVIADLAFGRADARGVRRARFVPRASIPLGAACLVANGLRETLRELFGERCELTIGEPAAIGPGAWNLLSREAYCFLTCGRQTDIVLVVPNGDARTLVLRAFGEGEPFGAPPLSTLELHAVERIAARCAAAFDPLCAERRGTSQRVAPAAVPACVAYFDVRVQVPVALEFGIGIVRELPDPGPTGSFSAGHLGHVPVEVRAEFASGTIDVATLLRLAPGDVIRLESQVDAEMSLKIGGRLFASGTAGVAGGRYSCEVRCVQQSMGARS